MAKLAFLVYLVSCGTAPTSGAPERPRLREVLWRKPISLAAREHIEADVSIFGVRAGQVEFEIAPSCDQHGSGAILVSRMSTVGVVRFFKATDGTSRTTMDLANGRPLASELTILDGEVVRRYSAVHQRGAVAMTYQRTGKEPLRNTLEIPPGEHALDMQSAFLLLRHWKAKPGELGYFYVLLGRNVWQVLASYEGVRDLEDSRGVSAHLVTGTAKRVDPEAAVHERRFSIWLSRGVERIPLLIEGEASFGTVTMKLSSREADRDRASVCSTAALMRVRSVADAESDGLSLVSR